MKALVFLVLKQFKNMVLSLVKKPSQLIITVGFIALMLLSFGSALFGEHTVEVKTYRSMEELYAIVFVLFTFFFVMFANNGFSSGASMYSMADVHTLFTAPLKPRLILGYGLVRQLGTAFMVCFFVLFQYSWLNRVYGVGIGFILLLLLCFMLVIILSQLVALLIYSATSADDDKKKKWRTVMYSVLGIAAAYVIFRVFSGSGDDWFARVTNALSGIGYLFPVSGWATAVLRGAYSLWGAVLALGLIGIFGLGALLVYIIGKTKTDYYEDVLQATEVAQSAITAKKQGFAAETVPKNVKLGKTGIGQGRGATAIYYKQNVESRRARVFILDMLSLIFIAVTILTVVMLNAGIASENEHTAPPDDGIVSEIENDALEVEINFPGIVTALAMSVYMMMFSSAMGRFAKELRFPYIYMIPEPPFVKLINCVRESLPKLAIESLILWVPLYFILEMNPVDLIFCMLSRMAIGLLFIAVNIFIERFISGAPKVVATTVYFLLCVVALIIPLVAGFLGFLLAGVLPVSQLSCFLLIAVPTAVLETGGILFMSRNMLQYAELNNA